jgi:hypothetical protein
MPESQPKTIKKINSSFGNGRIKTPSSDIELKVNYPEENPENCIEDITDTLRHIGIFDDITK